MNKLFSRRQYLGTWCMQVILRTLSRRFSAFCHFFHPYTRLFIDLKSPLRKLDVDIPGTDRESYGMSQNCTIHPSGVNVKNVSPSSGVGYYYGTSVLILYSLLPQNFQVFGSHQEKAVLVTISRVLVSKGARISRLRHKYLAIQVAPR